MPLSETQLPGFETDILAAPASCRIWHQKSSNLPTGVLGLPFVVASEDSTSATVSIFSSNSPAMQVIDCWGVMDAAGAASDTFKLTDGTNDITDAADCSSAGDTDIVRVGEIDDAHSTLAADETLNVVRASSCAASVYVLCVFKD